MFRERRWRSCCDYSTSQSLLDPQTVDACLVAILQYRYVCIKFFKRRSKHDNSLTELFFVTDYLEDVDRLVERPGPVSNERLFDREGKLLPKLELDVHYAAVAPEVRCFKGCEFCLAHADHTLRGLANRQVYAAFAQLYGGGPEIVRSSFDIYSSEPAAEENDEEAAHEEEEMRGVQATV